MNKNKGFSSSPELVSHTAKQFRFLIFYACMVLLAITLLSMLVNRSLSQLVELDTILRQQSSYFENLSRNITLASKLDPTKSVSTFKKINSKSSKLVALIKVKKTNANEILEQKSTILNFIFDKNQLETLFKIDQAEFAAIERLIDTMKNEKVLLGVNNIAYLRPVEVSIISRRPWAARFDLGNALLEEGLRWLFKAQSFVTIISVFLLLASTIVIYFFTFRPSFNYLRSTLQSKEEANSVRQAVVSIVTQRIDFDVKKMILAKEVANKLTNLASENETLKNIRFFVGANSPADAPNLIVSNIGLNPYSYEFLSIEMPEHLTEYKSIVAPYLDIISQNLRFQNELALRHVIESERDRALDLVGPLLENFPYPILVSDNLSKIVLANPAACELFDLDSSNLKGQDLVDLKTLHKTIAGSSNQVETMDGLNEEQSKEIFQYANGRILQWQIIELSQDNRRIFVAQDLTELLKDMSVKEHQRKMEALGKISGTISHDTNNFLAVIRSALEIATKSKAIKGRNRDLLDMALTSCLNASNLNKQLVSFSQKLDLHPQHIKFSDIKKEVVAFKESSFPEVELIWQIKQDPEILIDRTYLTSAIINLVKNAGTATNGHGRLRISTSRTKTDELKIRVQDNGPGFSKEELKNAIEPFYSNSRLGTGLGLSSVDGFIRQSGGLVVLSNSKGAVIELILPLSQQPKIDKPVSSEKKLLVAETDISKPILIIEDNKIFGDLLENYMNELSYETVRLETVQTGKEYLKENPSTNFKAVIADLVLPDGNGITLVKEVLGTSGQLPVILMTGYGNQIIQQEAPEFEFILMEKPFLISDLIENLEKLFDQTDLQKAE